MIAEEVGLLLHKRAESYKTEKFLPLAYRLTQKEQPLDYHTCNYLAAEDPDLLYSLRKSVPQIVISAMAQNLYFTEQYVVSLLKALVDDKETLTVAGNIAEAYNSSDVVFR